MIIGDEMMVKIILTGIPSTDHEKVNIVVGDDDDSTVRDNNIGSKSL